MSETRFYELVRRHPPRKKTSVASMVVIGSGLLLHVFNEATASVTRFLNDSLLVYGVLALLLVFLGLSTGFLLGRSPRLFGLMIVVVVLTYGVTAVVFRGKVWAPMQPAPSPAKNLGSPLSP